MPELVVFFVQVFILNYLQFYQLSIKAKVVYIILK